MVCYQVGMSAKALRDDAISIFTDGSSKQGPRRGGIAFRIVVTGEDGHEEVHERNPHGYPRATNNEMELQACVAALGFLASSRCPIDPSNYRRIVIYTDSMYVRKHIGLAISQWSRDKWTRRSGAPVVNAELWRDLIRAMKTMRRLGLPVDFEWVPGKSSEHTVAVDRAAKNSAERPLSIPLSGGIVRRKRSEEETDPGSVPMLGQSAEVYIIDSRAMRIQKCTRYRYRLQGGDLDGAIDFAFSKLLLKPGHAYRVRFNEEQANPWMVESFDEVSVA